MSLVTFIFLSNSTAIPPPSGCSYSIEDECTFSVDIVTPGSYHHHYSESALKLLCKQTISHQTTPNDFVYISTTESDKCAEFSLKSNEPNAYSHSAVFSCLWPRLATLIVW